MRKFYLFGLFLLSSFGIFGQCQGEIEITSFNPNPYPDQTFPPNTSVDVCITMNGWTEQNLNWLDGFEIYVEGWSSVSPLQPPDDIDMDTGDWIWAENVVSSFTGISAGPGYFFETTSGSVSGIIDNDPGNDFGDDCNLPNCSWTFCITLTTPSVIGTPLTLSVLTYGDGGIGSYEGGNVCNNPIDEIWAGEVGECPTGCTDPAACNFNPNAQCEDGSCDYLFMGEILSSFPSDTICTGLEVLYSVTGDPNSSYNWIIEGGNRINTEDPRQCKIVWGDIPGTYTISVQETTSNAGCVGPIESIEVVVETPNITFNLDQYSMCINSSVNLIAEPAGGTWSSEFMNGHTFVGTEAGTFNPSYIKNIYGCDITESVNVQVRRKYDAPNIIYSAEIINLCFDSGYQTYISEDTVGVTYAWFIDDVRQISTQNILDVDWYDTTRTYIVKVIAYDDIGCESEPKLISVKTESCQRFFAPNSFTPNGDGINDIFEIRGLSIYKPFMKIFNRWGVEVYVSSNLWWTGDSGNGYYCDNGVYNWIIEYKDKFGQNKEESGHVTLIR